jgi:hypothetical protein
VVRLDMRDRHRAGAPKFHADTAQSQLLYHAGLPQRTLMLDQ